MVEHKTVLL